MTDPRVGTVLAGHRVLSVIGRGGMSVVYLAEHIELHRHVALKVLGPELAEDDMFRERFIRESRMAAALDHPHVVTVYDAGESDGMLYISMRNVEGTDLEHLLRKESRLDPRRAVAIVSQAASALDAAHDAGLVHRDVKPGNILLTAGTGTSTDHAFLSDFGVTKRIETGAGLTRSGQFVGTVDYVAPEQIQDSDVDGRADVYSLACVLYRCLVGEVPFPRATEVATIYAHLQDPPPVPSDRRPDLPAGFDAPIARALAKSRDDRFDSCRGLADAARGVVQPSRALDIAPPAEPSRPKEPRKRIVLVALGLAVAASIAIAGVVLFPWGGDGGQSPSPSPSSSPSGPVPQLTWTRVTDQHAFLGPGDQAIVDATLIEGTIIAIGVDDSGEDADAAVWSSTNGAAWTRAATLGRTGDQRMDAIMYVGQELVAVGSERTGGDTDAAVWRSKDHGASWDRAEGATSGLHGAGDQAMRVVVAAAPGIVAAGSDAARGDLDAAVWTSKNGSDWNRETLPLPGDQQILDATTFDDDLILVGSSTSEEGDRDAGIWVRTGGTWTTIDSDALGGAGDQQIEAIGRIGSGPLTLVAVGWSESNGDVNAAVWTSTDGRRWDRVEGTITALDTEGDQLMSSVTSVNTTLVAGGESTVAGGETDVAIWLSTDGTNWERASSFDGLGTERVASMVALRSGRLLAAGSRGRGGNEQAAAWIASFAPSS